MAGAPHPGARAHPSVGLFFDEVYVSRPAGVAFDVFDLERIEVLRGPQGTLWGRNVVGGAIHLVTRKPGARPGGSLSATIGTFGRLELAGAFDTRLGESAAMRWAGSMRRHDGYVDNTFTGTELFDEDTLSLRGHLQLTPTDRRRILLTVDATRDRPLGPARHIKALEEGNPARALWRVTSGDLTTVRSFDQNNVTESYALFADATFTLRERWSLSTGLRLSHDAKDFSASTSGTANFVSDEFYSVTAAPRGVPGEPPDQRSGNTGLKTRSGLPPPGFQLSRSSSLDVARARGLPQLGKPRGSKPSGTASSKRSPWILAR